METQHTSSKPEGKNSTARETVHRPSSVTMLALGVLIFSAFCLARLVILVVDWIFWSEQLPVLIIYLALTGAVWFVIWASVGLGLWHGKTWAARIFLPLASGYTLYYWVDRSFLRFNSEYSNVPFTITLNILLLACVYWILSRTDTQVFFNEM